MGTSRCTTCGGFIDLPEAYLITASIGRDAQEKFISAMSDDELIKLSSVIGTSNYVMSYALDNILVKELVLRFSKRTGRRVKTKPGVRDKNGDDSDYIGVLRHGALMVTEVADRLNVSLSTASRSLSKMQKKGLVVSQRDKDDGRRMIYALVETESATHVCFPDTTPVEDTSDCPNSRLHTPCPDGYHGWHEWADEMMKTHKQEECPGCGLLAIWKEKNAEDNTD